MILLAGVALHEFGVLSDVFDEDAIAFDLLFVELYLTVELAYLRTCTDGVAYRKYRDIDGADCDDNCQHNPEVDYYA